MPLAEGEVIAGYRIVGSLGAGGMGEVYLAQHPRLPRYDALKLLTPSVCCDAEYRERFNREAEIAGSLWHPHIVSIHDRGDVDGQLWIAMDYVDGIDAGRLLSEQYPSGMPHDLVVRLVTAVGEALDHAHGKGLTHRDIKPANVLVANPGTDDERIMLADFGIARRLDDSSNLTGTNMTVGTVAYAAPEQLTGEVVDGRADQYALAATAYQLLTGTPPFQHSNPAVVISQHLTATPPPIGEKRPELASLGPVFDKALAKSPRDRFDRCVDFARALGHGMGALDHDGGATVAAQAATSGPRHARPVTPKGPSRRRYVVAAVVAVVVLGLIGAVAVLALDDERHGTSAAQAPSVPVVVVGADCATLGAAGVTEKGAPAYCARMPSSDSDLWSLYQGTIASPTVRTSAGEPSAPPEVLVCMQQTGDTRAGCSSDIARENADPAANDNVQPTP